MEGILMELLELMQLNRTNLDKILGRLGVLMAEGKF